MAWIDLVPVRDTDDIEHNFSVLQEAINAIDGSNIDPGTLPGQGGAYVPVTGGAFSGPVSAPALSVGSDPVARVSLTYSRIEADAAFMPIDGAYTKAESYSRTEVDALIVNVDEATLSDLGTLKKTATVGLASTTISNPPTQAEVIALANKINELINAMRASGQMA